MKAVNYDSNGDATDWMLHEHNIVAFNPEVGSDQKYADTFYVQKDKIHQVVSDFHPSVKFFMEMHRTQFELTSKKVEKNSFKFSLLNKGLATLYNADWSLNLKGAKGQDLKINSVKISLSDEEKTTRRRLSPVKSRQMTSTRTAADKSEYDFGMKGDLKRRFYLNFSVNSEKALQAGMSYELVVKNVEGVELAKFKAKLSDKFVKRVLKKKTNWLKN